MNDEEKKFTPNSDVEIEARIVAWIAGEASDFEIAELDRLLLTRPDLAVFKRRLEAVHGLVAEGTKPESAPLQLSPERRLALLRTLGMDSGAPEMKPAPVSPQKKSGPIHYPIPRRKRLWAQSALVAAALAVGFFAFEIRRYSKLEYARNAEVALARQEVSSQRMALEEREQAQRKSIAKRGSQPEPVGLPATSAPSAGAPRDVTNVELSASLPPELDANAAKQFAAGEPVQMKPFEVNADVDASYAASNTLAGTRIQVPVPALPPTDTGSLAFYEKKAASPGPSTGSRPENFLHARSTAFDKVAGENEAQSAGMNRSTSTSVAGDSPNGLGKPTEPQGQQVASDDETVTLSPLSGDGSGGENESGSLAGTRLRSDLKDQASAISVVTSDFLLATSASNNSSEQRAPGAATDTETETSKDAVSTFALHVSDASFRLAQAAMARNEWPDPASIRPEEFYNGLDYGDPSPSMAEKISCRIEQAADPFLPRHNVVRIAMKVPAVGRDQHQPLQITVLLDTSGSMQREDRAAAVHRALEVLVSLLSPNDRISIIGFAREPRLVAENYANAQAKQLPEIVGRIPAEGGTNLEEALKLGAAVALRDFQPGAQNRVVLLTDGATNLGDADPQHLATLVEDLRQHGIAFDACGVGLSGIDDHVLETLTRKGDGRYSVLDSAAAADANFARQLAGAFHPAAENVKVQVRFNPARVRRYRLIGFEQHRLNAEDFHNDQVDGSAELAANEAAVALYEIEPNDQGEGELGQVYVRFRDAASKAMVERSWTLPFDSTAPLFERASPSLQLTCVAAWLAESLRGGPAAEHIVLSDLKPVVSSLRARYANETRVQQLLDMFNQVERKQQK